MAARLVGYSAPGIYSSRQRRASILARIEAHSRLQLPALVAQWIERLASNQKVGGSIPSEGTNHEIATFITPANVCIEVVP